MGVLLHVCPCTTCVQYLRRPEEGVRISGTGVAEGREPSHGAWDSNLGRPEEQSVRLDTESSLQPLIGASTFYGSHIPKVKIYEMCSFNLVYQKDCTM